MLNGNGCEEEVRGNEFLYAFGVTAYLLNNVL